MNINDMRKSLFPTLLAGLVLVAAACNRMSRDEQIAREAREYTMKECPRYVDKSTRMDSTTYDIATRTFAYNYTVEGELDNPALYTEQVKSAFRDKVLREIRSSIPMKSYKDEGLTIIYRYLSASTGETRLEYRFEKEEYR